MVVAKCQDLIEARHESASASRNHFSRKLIGFRNLGVANPPSDIVHPKGATTLKGTVGAGPAIDCLDGCAGVVLIHGWESK